MISVFCNTSREPAVEAFLDISNSGQVIPLDACVATSPGVRTQQGTMCMRKVGRLMPHFTTIFSIIHYTFIISKAAGVSRFVSRCFIVRSGRNCTQRHLLMAHETTFDNPEDVQRLISCAKRKYVVSSLIFEPFRDTANCVSTFKTQESANQG